jgi:thymidine phosphorylase
MKQEAPRPRPRRAGTSGDSRIGQEHVNDFTFDAPTVIRTKRDGGALSDAAIDWVIDGYTHGRVADEQMSALLMAIFLKGMTGAEIARWTAAMVDSGERLNFTDLRRDGKPLALVDKHSTGGVGDKITIPLVPVVMACGGAVPQAAGRGLGHTGGTLDKLESIPGFTAEISKAQIRQQLCDLGAAIFAAGELAPADRKIYALRDVTATTESLPLIASSVMSKKIAEGTRALVLDSKVGSGAFLATEAESRELASTMVELGTAEGLVTRALLTDMETPLGRTVGNAVEVEESLEVLAGGGPADVVELTLALAGEMLDAAGLDGIDPAETLKDGSAMDRFRELVAAQGGDLSRPLPSGAYSETIPAPRDGTMGLIDAMAVGLTVWRLGAGRSVPGERVQSGAGLRIHRRPGEPVAAGEALFTLYTDTPERFEAAMAELDGAWSVGDTAPEHRPLIIDRITSCAREERKNR